ncbi:MAG: NTP transferase domain-containing protein [Bacteroidaceae bacterium]|nr:NTP transferase domain-containing protein [Bacteroidaceae bacterium]
MQELKNLYIATFGFEPVSVEPLKGAGSNRRYFRMYDKQGATVIGAVGTSDEENNAFLTIAEHFRKQSLPVPEIFAVSADKMRYLQQDLGSRSLFDALKEGREKGGDYSEEECTLLRKVIAKLPELQILGAKNMDWSVCYPQPEFDEENVMFDLNYFKYCFLKPSGIDFNEVTLQKDFIQLAKDLTSQSNSQADFMYRDFQARNIMLDDDDNPWFIDFQGGRKGPGVYDLVSFLWQASAKYPQKLRDELIDVYQQQYSRLSETYLGSTNSFDKSEVSLFVLFRLLQVLGAYGFRGYFERKKHFIDSIPPAIENLRQLLQANEFPYPYLTMVLNALTHTATPTLTVRITSFSYKKGIPEDPSGNGGGYVFDCRSTHNPGRYEPYKMLTGLDAPVIKFLEDDGEILEFLDSVYKLADSHVARYIERGFTSLMFSFGCTGGQHRSVYSAQHLAEHLKEKFGSKVNIELCHREQQPQAFILAAGLGTRLKPLTDTMPKALVRVGEKTLLQRTIDTLRSADFKNIVVNVHHFADQIKSYLQYPSASEMSVPRESVAGLSISISDETDKLLDTGGGLLKARYKFSQARPILIHNVDIVSNADLQGLMKSHQNSQHSDALPVATLLVSSRSTSRYLHFDDDNNLIGWQNVNTGEAKGRLGKPYAFSGIHVVSPVIFPLLEEYAEKVKSVQDSNVGQVKIPKFSITDFYLWACQKTTIKAFVQDNLNLTDVGKLDTLNSLKI